MPPKNHWFGSSMWNFEAVFTPSTSPFSRPARNKASMMRSYQCCARRSERCSDLGTKMGFYRQNWNTISIWWGWWGPQTLNEMELKSWTSYWFTMPQVWSKMKGRTLQCLKSYATLEGCSSTILHTPCKKEGLSSAMPCAPCKMDGWSLTLPWTYCLKCSKYHATGKLGSISTIKVEVPQCWNIAHAVPCKLRSSGKTLQKLSEMRGSSYINRTFITVNITTIITIIIHPIFLCIVFSSPPSCFLSGHTVV